MNSPLVSILIPNYNKELFIDGALDSILNQSYLNWECVIVDDHSTDNSWKVLEKYASIDSRFKIFRRPDFLKKGANSCRNYAFNKSNGNFVNWFDSDDLMNSNFIELKLKKLNKLPELDFIVSKMDAIGIWENRNMPSNVTQTFIIHEPVDILFHNMNFHTSGPMFRKSALIGRKLFDIELNSGQEKEFFFRLIKIGDLKFDFMDHVLTFRRESFNSIWSLIHKNDSYLIKKDTHRYFWKCFDLVLLPFNIITKKEFNFFSSNSIIYLKISLVNFDFKYTFYIIFYLFKLFFKYYFR